MTNLIASGFLFVGGAIIMNVSQFGKTVPIMAVFVHCSGWDFCCITCLLKNLGRNNGFKYFISHVKNPSHTHLM